jgi:predicted RNA-binding Zn-ribbon protein involved in translation (DUF1610 family)
MTESIVGQPLTEVTVFECAACRVGPIKTDKTRLPYPCPFCGKLLVKVGTEWEERHSSVTEAPGSDAPVEKI